MTFVARPFHLARWLGSVTLLATSGLVLACTHLAPDDPAPSDTSSRDSQASDLDESHASEQMDADEEDSGERCIDPSADDPAGPAVNFEIVNRGTTPLFIDSVNGSECFVAFDVEGPEGRAVAWMPIRERCFALCRDLSSECSSTCQGQGECNGAIPGVTLAPGATFRATWTGLVAEIQRSVPAGCDLHQNCAPDSCLRFVAPSPGTYRVTVTTGRSLNCDAPPCECDPGPQGFCEWSQFPGLLDAATSTLEFEPGTTPTVVFEL